MMLQEFNVRDLGLISFKEAFKIQKEVHEKRAQNEISDTLLFCSHPSVVTLGRATQAEDLQGWTGSIIETNRGGRATYHGPGQVICYPIVKLKNNSNLFIPEQDVRAYLECFEKIIIGALSTFNLKAQALSGSPLKKGQLNRGVWIEGKKVASLGIAIKKWVTLHGAALNIAREEGAFSGIQACGFQTSAYGFLEDFGVKVAPNKVKELMIREFKKVP